MSSTIISVPAMLAPSRSAPDQSDAPDTLLRYRDVIARCGIARQTIDRLEQKGKFPRRVRIGRATRWSARAIQRWIDEQIARAGR
jgi:predicted DNA-binding transcriptional regulator AlpA